MLLSSWASSATTASKGVPDTQSREDNETPRETAEELADTDMPARRARVFGRFGPPRVCELPGDARLPRRRGSARQGLRNKLFKKAARRAGGVDELEREVFRMAAGGEDGCRLVRDQRFIKELVDTMGSWTEAQDLAAPGLIDIAEGQPLRLKLIRAILLQAEIGLGSPTMDPRETTSTLPRLSLTRR